MEPDGKRRMKLGLVTFQTAALHCLLELALGAGCMSCFSAGSCSRLFSRFWLLISLALIAYVGASVRSARPKALQQAPRKVYCSSVQDMILVPLSVYNLDITSFELPGTRLGFVWEFEDVDKGAPLAAFMGRPLQPRHPMTIFSATFWTLDFVLAFFVGYYVSGIPSRFENRGAAHALQHLMGLPPLTHVLQGTLELRPQYTSRNYAKTWMVPDLILLMPRGLEWQALMNIHQLGRNCWWCVSFQRSDQGLNGSTLRCRTCLPCPVSCVRAGPSGSSGS